ncbi:MAG: threonine-phosphate decarboxylase [Pseudomonadota bacterium]
MMQVQRTDFTYHGGRIDQARQEFPDAPRPWIDLSTGINPLAWRPPEGLEIDLASLPLRQDLAALEETAARYFSAVPECVAAVPGSEVALRLLASLDVPAPIMSAVPSYGTHTEIAEHHIPCDDLCDASRSGTLLLANPNNPDGRIHQPQKLLELARTRSAKGGWLVIDEAFSDANPEASVVPHLTGDEPIIVFRSFGKFFGLAGLRLGFVIAPPLVISRLHALLGDWPVSAQAISYGLHAYSDWKWIAATRTSLAMRATDLDECLTRHGLKVHGDCPLFRLAGLQDANAMFRRLARRGILVRPFADHPRRLRFGLPQGATDLARLDAALGND